MINNHPNTQLLTDYATGGLSMAPLISITTHLQFCDQCREAVSGLNILGGELLTECDEAELSEDLLAQTLAMLDAPMMANAETAPAIAIFKCEFINFSPCVHETMTFSFWSNRIS